MILGKEKTRHIDAAQLRARITGEAELALLDVREEGVFARAHLLFAVPLALSRLELRIDALVPRRATPIVTLDDDDGLAVTAASRLASLGYSDIAILSGGVPAWAAAGYELFSGVHVPSKAFGEIVEHDCKTPSISAAELKAKLDDGQDLVILDSRPFDEYRRMSIPTGIDMPGAELVLRVHDVVRSPETLVVVNCAGRTRSIIGAQSLINAGINNPVVALRNGTMGWELAGLALDRGQDRRAAMLSAAGLARARACAARVARQYGVRTIDLATLAQWRMEAEQRSLYLLDVRGPEEFAAGHLPGSISAPGGQLVQATDLYVGTMNARLVLIDDTGVRAVMTASWLAQMGWREAVVLAGGLAQGGLEMGPYRPRVLGLDGADAAVISAADLRQRLEAGAATVVDLSLSRDYRAGHIPGAWFAIRARLAASLKRVRRAGVLVLTCGDGVLARLAAPEVAAIIGAPVMVLAGGNAAWRAGGFPVAAGEEHMADAPDDVWLRPYERASGTDFAAAMNEYLTWEVELVDQLARDGTARFAPRPPA